MMSDSRKRKLQILTRSILRGDFAAAKEVLRDGNQPPAPGQSPTDGQAKDSGPIELAAACGGQECVLPGDAGRKFWLIRRTLGQVSPDLTHVNSQYASILRGARQRLDELEASPALCHVANSRPEDLLFMDIETCGLSGTAIFLVGVMFFEQEELVFEQLLAQDYSQEAAILSAYGDKLAAAGVLVTFNGKAFDTTQIRERSAFHGLVPADGPGPPHLDLLSESRKRWRGRLPNCRLQTLEEHLCSRRRMGDIPGWAIPDAYHQFVKTRDARQLREILHHNMLDLLTMAQLLCVILTGSDPVAAASQLPPE